MTEKITKNEQLSLDEVLKMIEIIDINEWSFIDNQEYKGIETKNMSGVKIYMEPDDTTKDQTCNIKIKYKSNINAEFNDLHRNTKPIGTLYNSLHSAIKKNNKIKDANSIRQVFADYKKTPTGNY